MNALSLIVVVSSSSTTVLWERREARERDRGRSLASTIPFIEIGNVEEGEERKMRFSLAVLGVFAALASSDRSTAAAFAPKSFGVVPRNRPLAAAEQDQKNTEAINNKRRSSPFGLHMVAGGAERAYGDDYYDGMCVYY